MTKDTRPDEPVSRRDWMSVLGVMGGALGLAHLTACAQEGGSLEAASSEASALTGTPTWFDTVYGPDGTLSTTAGAQLGQACVCAGRSVPGDGGGGVFYWTTDTTSPGDEGTIVVPTGPRTGCWKRLYSGAINVRWFGATGGGTENDHPAFAFAVNACQHGDTLFIPRGDYLFMDSTSATELLLVTRAISVVGEGLASRIIVARGISPQKDVIRIAPVGSFQLARLAQFVVMAAAPGSPAGAVPCRHGIYLDVRAAGATISNLVVEQVFVGPFQFNGAGVALENADGKADGVFTSVFRDCVVYGGMAFYNVGDSVHVERCTLTGVGLGLDLRLVHLSNWNYASSLVIEKCNITTTLGAIRVHSGSQVKILYNNVEQPAGAPPHVEVISLKGDVGRLGKPEVRGNRLSRGDAGIIVGVNACDAAILEDNTFVFATSNTTCIHVASEARATFVGDNLGVGAAVSVSDVGIGTCGVFRPVSASGPVEPFFHDGWVNRPFVYAQAGFTKSGDGTVSLKGEITKVSPSMWDVIFVLPPEYRPSELMQFAVESEGPAPDYVGARGRIKVQPTGEVQYMEGMAGLGGSTGGGLSLSGVTFSVPRFFVGSEVQAHASRGDRAFAGRGAYSMDYPYQARPGAPVADVPTTTFQDRSGLSHSAARMARRKWRQGVRAAGTN